MPSIGSIFVDFVARTAQFQTDVKTAGSTLRQETASMGSAFASVSASGSQMTASMERAGLRIGASFLGARTVAMAAAREIKDVYANINNIPGVPQETIDSINRMKYELEGSNSVLKQGIAKALGWFSDLGSGIGYAFGSAVYGADAAADAMKSMNDEAARFAATKFNDEMAKLQEQAKQLSMSKGELADYLSSAANALETQGNGSGGTQQERWDALTQAMKDRIQAEKSLNALTKESEAAWAAYDVALGKVDHAHESTSERVARLREEIHALKDDLSVGPILSDSTGGKQTEEEIAKVKELTEKTKELGVALAKLKEPATIMRNTFVQGMEGMADKMAEFVVTGKANFADFFKTLEQQIISTFIKLSIINPLLNALFSGSSGYNALPAFASLAGFADGGDPPLGAPSIVGENGPELFIPKQAGTIVPNSALASIGGGGGGVTVIYNITSGVTRNDLAPILDLHAQRVKGDVADAMRRGGGPSRAFGR